MTMPLHGGSPVALASGIPAIAAIAIDDDAVYLTSSGTEERSRLDGTVLRIPVR